MACTAAAMATNDGGLAAGRDGGADVVVVALPFFEGGWEVVGFVVAVVAMGAPAWKDVEAGMTETTSAPPAGFEVGAVWGLWTLQAGSGGGREERGRTVYVAVGVVAVFARVVAAVVVPGACVAFRKAAASSARAFLPGRARAQSDVRPTRVSVASLFPSEESIPRASSGQAGH